MHIEQGCIQEIALFRVGTLNPSDVLLTLIVPGEISWRGWG